KEYGRIYIDLGGEPFSSISPALLKVFGLHSFSPAVRCSLDVESIKKAVLESMHEATRKPRTFKVSVRRVNKQFPYDTYEMNRLLGGVLLESYKDMKVDVHHPELDIRVEIRDKEVLVFSEVIPGPGGFPLGTNGKAMLLLSGGID